MEAVGQLTGGIAHDINNLLTVILGNIDLLMRRIEDDRPQRQFSAIRHAAERGQALTQQLLAFSRRQQLHPQALDVNTLVRRFEPLIRRAVGESIGLEIAQSDKPLVCEVDPSELEMALLNLAVNSRDAMPKGGTLRIALKYSAAVNSNIPRPVPAWPGDFDFHTGSLSPRVCYGPDLAQGSALRHCSENVRYLRSTCRGGEPPGKPLEPDII